MYSVINGRCNHNDFSESNNDSENITESESRNVFDDICHTKFDEYLYEDICDKVCNYLIDNACDDICASSYHEIPDKVCDVLCHNIGSNDNASQQMNDACCKPEVDMCENVPDFDEVHAYSVDDDNYVCEDETSLKCNKKTECLRLGNLNTRSLVNKFDNFSIFVKKFDFDIIGVNETWLDESINSSEIEIANYSIIRKDRNRFGGGVCLFIKDSIQYNILDIGNCIESSWISIKLKDNLLIIGTIYRPPSSNQEYFDNILNVIQRAKDISDHVIVMGDLNFDCINVSDTSKNQISYMEELFDMKQLISSPTRETLNSKSLIDVILTTDCEKHFNNNVIKVAMSDHYCVVSDYYLHEKLTTVNHKQITFRDYRKFCSEDFVNDLSKCSDVVSLIFEEENLEDRWNKFKMAFLDISNKHAPFRTMRLKDRKNPWVTPEIVRKMYRRDFMKRKAVKNKDPVLFMHYRKLRNEITSELRKKRKTYYSDKLSVCAGNPKHTWKVINELTRTKKHVNTPGNLSASSFNDYFTSIGKEIISQTNSKPENVPWKNPPCKSMFCFDNVKMEDILSKLQKLGCDSNNDVLGFDSKLLYCGRRVIAPVLTKLLNASLSMSFVVDDWKFARVTPVYKDKGDIAIMNNYRPISVIGHLAKIFESNVHKQLLNYFIENNFITTDQSAYLARHNTQTALHRVIDDCIDNICSKTFTGICSFDIKKCFDSIDHDLLLAKIQFYGIKGNTLKWFRSYLTNRNQIVKLNNEQSDKQMVMTGVPQGSILGPLLFVIFVNDISQYVGTATANLYADDTLIYCNGDTMVDVQEKLQNCVDDVSEWYQRNNIVVNTDKSCAMVVRSRRIIPNHPLDINVNNRKLEQVKVMNYLGMEIDEALTWNEHITKLCKKLAFKVSKLARLKKFLDKDTLKKIYNATIQPCIDYAISVWGSTTNYNLNRVQRLQNHCARIIENNFDYINVRGLELVSIIGWMNIRERFLYFQILLIFKCIYGLAPTYLTNNVIFDFEVSNRTTRSHEMNLYMNVPDNEFHKNMLFYSGAREWNKLPNHLKDCYDIVKFKCMLKKYIRFERR